MNTEPSFFYHWIPQISELGIEKQAETPKKEPWVIGIIDSSGSMSSWWKHVAKNYNELIDNIASKKVITFCFSQSIYNEPTNKLNSSISRYGGGMTNIYLAMKELQTKL